MATSTAVDSTEMDEASQSPSVGEASSAHSKIDEMPESSNSVPVLKEFEALNHMLNLIPHKAQRGLKVFPIDLTCLDASKCYIALGSNMGVLFLYNREKQSLQRLTCDSKNEVLSCVKMQQSLEYQIAMGTYSGLLTIFILPSILPGRNKQLLKFTIPGLHKSRVTCLEWSTNGMKLYSGDEEGNIVCTQIDVEKGQCASDVILKESHKVVQLDYAHKTLLVSTRMRTILCHTEEKNTVTQVGQKDRKCLGNFGACFVAGVGQKDSYLYATRPGLRVWKAGLDGSVMATFILKDILNNSSCPPIELLDTLSPIKTVVTPSDRQFGPVLVYDKKHIMTWNESTLYVLDPEVNTVVAVSNKVGVLKCIVTCDDEIFILRIGSERNVIRIAQKPEDVSFYREHPRLSVLELTPPPSPVSKTLTSSSSSSNDSLAPNQAERKKQSTSPLHMLFGKIKHKNKETTSIVEQQVKRKSPFGFNKSGAGTMQVTDNANVGFKPVNLPDSIGASDSLKTNLMAPQAVKCPIPELGVDVRDTVSPDLELPPVVKLNSSEILKINLTTELDSQLKGTKSTEQTIESQVTNVMGASAGRAQTKDTNSNLAPKVGGSRDLPKPTQKGMPKQQASADRFSQISKQAFDDVVFQPKVKKKAKKKSPKTNKNQKDPDTQSVASVESTSDENRGQQPPQVVQDHQPPLDPNLLQDIKNIISSKEADSSAVKPDITAGLQDESSALGTCVDSNTETECSETKSTYLPAPIKEESAFEKQSEITQTKVDNIGSVLNSEESLFPKNELSAKDKYEAASTFNEDSVSKNMCDKVLENGNFPIQGETKDINQETEQGSIVYSSKKKREKHGLGKKAENGHNVTRPKKTVSEIDTNMKKDYAFENMGAPVETIDAQQTKSPDTPSEDIYSSFLSETDGERGPPIYKTSDASMEELYKGFSEDSLAVKEASSLAQPGGFQTGASISTASPLESSVTSQDAFEGQKLDEIWSKISESWTECPLQGNLQDLKVSSRHVWYVDRNDRVFWAPISEHGLPWKQLDMKANQIAVSPNGFIVWRLHGGVVHAATKISAKNPGGLKWVEALRGVACISVDDSSAWYIKNSGDVMMQKNLTKDRPCFKSFSVTPSMKLLDIHCHKGVVWAIDENRRLVVRCGIKPNNPTGSGWKYVDSATSISVTSISLGDQYRGWLMDIRGQVWFCGGVSPLMPEGDGKWWQVMFSEYLVHDPTAMDTFKNLADVLDPQQNLSKVTNVILGQQGGFVAAGELGLFVSPESKAVLQVCRGNLLGHDWFQATPVSMATSTRWSLVSATVANGPTGLVWASQPNGELFCFTPDSRQFTCVSVPMGCLFTCMSTTIEAVWGLTGAGEVYIRSGIGPHCPQGASWVKLDLDQLGDSKLVNVSCGTENVWAVDDQGAVFLRIGVKAPSSHYLNPAWVQVDGTPASGAIFTSVVTGPEDWMVWATDNKKGVYVRASVTYEMPIGTHWAPVSGTQVQQLCVSSTTVWALNPQGEILCRYGICKANPFGDYWKKIPGNFQNISASAINHLWGITKDGGLFQHKSKYLKRKEETIEENPAKMGRTISTNSDGDWELL